MSHCSSCGKELQVLAKFCGHCGASALALPPLTKTSPSKSVREDSRVVREEKHTDSTGADIAQTIFVVPLHFAQTLDILLTSLSMKCLEIVAHADAAVLIDKTQEAIRKWGFTTAKYVCILGDWDDVPPSRIPNTMMSDGDEFCLTDAFYGTRHPYEDTDPCSSLPELAVGRVPTLDQTVIKRLLLRTPNIDVGENAFYFGVTAECWQMATTRIIESFPNLPPNLPSFPEPGSLTSVPELAIFCSPNWNADDLNALVGGGLESESKIVLFNVHGGPDEPRWVGEGDGGQYVCVFEPGTIQNFNATLIVCEACYGGALGYEELSVVEKFFEKGGTSFVGSSTIAYGAPDSPLSAADLIAKHYVKGLYDGLAQGEALTRAKAEVLTDDPMDFEVALKTVLSFNLFGLPSQRLIKQESASLISTESTSTSTNTRFSQGSVLNRVRAGLPSSTQASGGLLSSIRDRYRSRLPQRNQQFMIERDKIAKILREFKDFSKVEKILTEMGSSLEDCTLDFVSAGESEGYRLFGFSKKRKAKNTLILFFNKSGQIKKTITSKGRS